jgi:hypothetical protein
MGCRAHRTARRNLQRCPIGWHNELDACRDRSKRSFEAGVRTRIDILNAEQQLGIARRDLAQARFTYLVSLVRLKALAGEPMDANIAEVNRWLVK